MEIQGINEISFREFAERIFASEPSGSLLSYALSSFLNVLNGEDTDNPDKEILKLWIVSMSVNGKKVSTCKRYFTKVQSVYNKWACGDRKDDPFAFVSPLFESLHDVSAKETERNLELVKRLFIKNEKSKDWQTVCIFFYLLFNPAASMSDVINLKFDAVPVSCPQIDDIVNSFDATHGRKYVFELKQGKSRPDEISRNLTKLLLEILSAAGMRFGYGFSRTSITSMWIAAALKSGMDIRDIRACTGTVPPQYSALSLLEKTELDDATRDRFICTAADTINSHAKRWFVMRLRQGVSADDIKARIEATLPGRLKSMVLYYPTYTEIYKEGKKRRVEEIPYLPGIIFFKTGHDKIKSLFANIGDLAWCFRASNSPESDYSVVSHRQMTKFQQCVGQFTPDIRMELVESDCQLERGRRVRVVGGIMAGYEGEILDVEGEPGRRMFFLSISDNKKARWTAYVEDVLIQPLD